MSWVRSFNQLTNSLWCCLVCVTIWNIPGIIMLLRLPPCLSWPLSTVTSQCLRTIMCLRRIIFWLIRNSIYFSIRLRKILLTFANIWLIISWPLTWRSIWIFYKLSKEDIIISCKIHQSFVFILFYSLLILLLNSILLFFLNILFFKFKTIN